MKADTRSLAYLVGSFAVTFAAAGIGSLFTTIGLSSWYDTIAKPAWTPSGAVIGGVWSVLYTFMAVAAWLVWRQGGFKRQRPALVFYLIQLAFNLLWSVLFFGVRSPAAALVGIVVLFGTVAVTLYLFWGASRVAGVLMVPYLAWVGFAGFLNFTIWRLNG